MNFADSEEQVLLRDSVRRFAATAHPFRGEHVRGALAARSQWSTVAANGWPAIALSEDAGGLGVSLVDICILLEEFGRGLVVEPYVSCLLLAAGLVDRLGSPTQKSLLPHVLEGETLLALAHEEDATRGDVANVALRARRDGNSDSNTWRLDGRKLCAIGAAQAQTLVVSARTSGDAPSRNGISLFLVSTDAPAISLTPYATVDNHPAADIIFENTTAELLGPEGDAAGALDEAIAQATLASCAELVGGMERVLQVTRDYATTRRQFGKPISAQQVVQHKLADMFVETEMSRSALYAALAAATNGESVVAAASGAKAFIAKAARFVCETGIQLHGGMGMADAVEVGHHYRRALALDALHGNADFHLGRYAASAKAATQP
jgi:alkylation response protein AidB-like acyl-CoA dehydrogenase